MFKKLLVFLGLRQASKYGFVSRNSAYLAPVGGVLPAIAWLAWQNRDRIREVYKTRVAPKLHSRSTTTAHGAVL